MLLVRVLADVSEERLKLDADDVENTRGRPRYGLATAAWAFVQLQFGSGSRLISVPAACLVAYATIAAHPCQQSAASELQCS